MTGNTINAILAYGLEAFVIDDDSMKTIKDILCKAIKQIFDLHSYVPDDIMLVDLGIYHAHSLKSGLIKDFGIFPVTQSNLL